MAYSVLDFGVKYTLYFKIYHAETSGRNASAQAKKAAGILSRGLSVFRY